MFSFLVKKSKCPSCGIKRTPDETRELHKFIDRLFEQQPRWSDWFYRGEKELAYDKYTRGNGWACDECTRKDLVLLADLEKQEYLDWPPYFVYLEKERECRTCGSEFLFSKEEQKFWYETLGFWVQSEAVNCKECRADIRKRRDRIREAQKELQEISPNLNFDSIEQLENVIELYKITESHNKVKQYTDRLNKLIKQRSRKT